MRKMDPAADYLSQLGYEERDVSLVTLVKWGIGLFVFMLSCAGVSLVTYFLFVPTRFDAASGLSKNYNRRLPPGPVLQANPVKEIRDYRAAEAADGGSTRQLRGGKYQIPVEAAMESLAAKGLPDPSDSRRKVRFESSFPANVPDPGGAVPGK